MATSYTSLLGLALPVTGELQGTWGDVVNNYITSYIDASVAGTQTISGSQTAVTLSVTNGTSLTTVGSGATGSAQFQIINCTGNPGGLLTITAPASSRQYIIINATSTNQSVKIVGSGPTTGVTLVAGEKAHVAWNGSDFVKIATQSGNGDFVTVDTTNLEVTNIKAKDGTAALSIADSTGVVSVSANPVLSGGTANGVVYLNGSKVATSGSALVFDGTNLGVGTNSPSSYAQITAYGSGDSKIWGETTSATGLAQVHVRGTSAKQSYFWQASASYVTYHSLVAGNAGIYATTNLSYEVDAAGYQNWWTNGSERVRITSGGQVNIGGNFTSTNNTLQVTGNTAIGYTTAAPTTGLIVAGDVGIGTDSVFGKLTVQNANVRMEFKEFSSSNLIESLNNARTATAPFRIYGSEFKVFTGAAGSYSDNLTLDTSGNLGLGVTPSAWRSTWKAFQISNRSLAQTGAGAGDLTMVFNGYFDSTDSRWEFQGAGDYAARYSITGAGVHSWHISTAAGANANDPITFNQAMTLDASGNLLIGNTGGTQRLTVSAANPTNGYVASIANSQGTTGRTGTYLLFDATSLAAWKIGIPPDVNAFSFYDVLAGTERARIDSSGNLLIGTTTLAYSAAGRGLVELNGSSSSLIALKTGDTARGYFAASSTLTELAAVGASQPLLFTTNGSERARITSGGDFGIGGISPVPYGANNRVLQIDGGANASEIRLTNNTTGTAATNGGLFQMFGNDLYIWNVENSFMSLGTNNGEKARITSGGYFKASNNGTYASSTGALHELKGNPDDNVLRVENYQATLTNTISGVRIIFSAASPNTTSRAFLYCEDSTSLRASIRSNGGLANYQSNNVDLSDIRTKTDINPVASYWNKIASLEIVSYKYKDQTHDDLNIGVIAQQVEQVAPEFVDPDGFGETPEDGVPLKTIYNKDLTFAAIKALQEAMARIEKLEAEVAALKGV